MLQSTLFHSLYLQEEKSRRMKNLRLLFSYFREEKPKNIFHLLIFYIFREGKKYKKYIIDGRKRKFSIRKKYYLKEEN